MLGAQVKVLATLRPVLGGAGRGLPAPVGAERPPGRIGFGVFRVCGWFRPRFPAPMHVNCAYLLVYRRFHEVFPPDDRGWGVTRGLGAVRGPIWTWNPLPPAPALTLRAPLGCGNLLNDVCCCVGGGFAGYAGLELPLCGIWGLFGPFWACLTKG